MAIKATSTKQLIIEYFNCTLMANAFTVASAVAYSGYTGNSPGAATVFGLMGSATALPALILGFRSIGRLLEMTAGPRKLAPITYGVYDAPMDGPMSAQREITINSKRSLFHKVGFLKTFAFDPSLRNDPDMKSRQMKYKEPKPRLTYWELDVLPRPDREAIRVRLYQDLVEDIIEKSWRQQERLNNPHPLGQDKLMSLYFACRGGRRLLFPEYLAFLELGYQFQFIVGRRKGSSGKLGGTPQWCRKQLGIEPRSPTLDA